MPRSLMPTKGSQPLKNTRHERMAMHVAHGMSVRKAYESSGYHGASVNAYKIWRLERFKDRVTYLTSEMAQQTTETTVHNRMWIDTEMQRVYEWCIGVRQVAKPCPQCGQKFEKLRDTKFAVKLLELFGLEQGMFKRQLDVTSRKADMVEGTQDQIIGRIAQLMERLGIQAIAQLLGQLAPDNLRAALDIAGIEVKPQAEGEDGDVLDIEPEGDTADGGEPRAADAHALPAVSEAGMLS